MMKLLYMPLLILLMVPAIAADPIDKVAALLAHGNTAELSKMLAANIEITMQDDENVYSKTQASLILDKFFAQNKPLSAKILHKVNSNTNYLFGVLILNTSNGSYRIACTLKETEGSLKLIELRIEAEKMK